MDKDFDVVLSGEERRESRLDLQPLALLHSAEVNTEVKWDDGGVMIFNVILLDKQPQPLSRVSKSFLATYTPQLPFLADSLIKATNLKGFGSCLGCLELGNELNATSTEICGEETKKEEKVEKKAPQRQVCWPLF
jgi:hypothetical protein